MSKTFMVGGTTRPWMVSRTGSAAPPSSHSKLCEKGPTALAVMRARMTCAAPAAHVTGCVLWRAPWCADTIFWLLQSPLSLVSGS